VRVHPSLGNPRRPHANHHQTKNPHLSVVSFLKSCRRTRKPDCGAARAARGAHYTVVSPCVNTCGGESGICGRKRTPLPRDDEPPGVGPRCWRRIEPPLVNAAVGAATAGQSGTSCPGRRSAGGCLSPAARTLRRGACFAPAPPGLRAGRRLAPSIAGACAASSCLMSAGDNCGRLT